MQLNQLHSHPPHVTGMCRRRRRQAGSSRCHLCGAPAFFSPTHTGRRECRKLQKGDVGVCTSARSWLPPMCMLELWCMWAAKMKQEEEGDSNKR